MSRQKIKNISFMKLFRDIKVNGKISLDRLCHNEKINNAFKFVYDSICDNILISFEQFKRNTIINQDHYDIDIDIPILTCYHLINYANKESVDLNEIPEVLDFIEKYKHDNPTVLYYSIAAVLDTFAGITLAINNFFKRNRTYLANIVVACIIEEILTGKIPTIYYLDLRKKQFKPSVMNKIIIEINSKLSDYGIRLSQLTDQYSMDQHSGITFVDPYTLGQQKLFHMYQYTTKSFKYNDDK